MAEVTTGSPSRVAGVGGSKGERPGTDSPHRVAGCGLIRHPSPVSSRGGRAGPACGTRRDSSLAFSACPALCAWERGRLGRILCGLEARAPRRGIT